MYKATVYLPNTQSLVLVCEAENQHSYKKNNMDIYIVTMNA